MAMPMGRIGCKSHSVIQPLHFFFEFADQYARAKGAEICQFLRFATPPICGPLQSLKTFPCYLLGQSKKALKAHLKPWSAIFALSNACCLWPDGGYRHIAQTFTFHALPISEHIGFAWSTRCGCREWFGRGRDLG